MTDPSASRMRAGYRCSSGASLTTWLWSETEKNEIEARSLASEERSQRGFIVSSRSIRRSEVRRHRMDIRCRTRDVIQERLLRHPVVALGVEEGHVTLVSPEDMHQGPWNLLFEARCQSTVERSRSAPTRQHERTPTAASRCLTDGPHGGFADSKTQVPDVGADAEIRLHDWLRYPSSADHCSSRWGASPRTNRSMALANPSSVLDDVTNMAAR